MANAARWIRLRDAVTLLADDGLPDATAKAQIADRIRDGVLPLKAALYIERAAHGAISWERRIPKPRSRLIVVPGKVEVARDVSASLWLESSDWQADVARWQWGPGNVVIHRQGTKMTSARVQMWEVTVDVSKMQQPALPKAELTSREAASPRGAKLGSDWAEWVASLSALIFAGDVPQGCSGRKLHELVTDNMPLGAKELEYSKVEATAAAVLRRLGEAG